MDILYNAFGSVLRFLYDIVNNYGLSIILFSVFAKIILLPFTIKQMKSMKIMRDLNPQIKAVQEKYKDDKQKVSEETMKIYKANNYNPLSGCLPLLLQFPLIIGLFRVLREPATWVFKDGIYDTIDKSFFWISDLAASDTMFILPVVVAVVTYLSQLYTQKATGQSNKMMPIFMSLMIGYFAYTFPAGLALYWFMQTLLTFAQQYVQYDIIGKKEKAVE